MKIKTYLGNLSIQAKILIGYCGAFILVLIIGFAIIYPILYNSIQADIKRELNNSTKIMMNMVESAADTSVKNYLRAIAEQNKNMVELLNKQIIEKTINEKEAKMMATDIFLNQHIGVSGYTYCIDSKGIIVVHPNKALLGEDLTIYGFIKKQIDEKEGYLEYRWQIPGEAVLRNKALYMTYFKPWDWIISASANRDEFRSLISVSDFKDKISSIKFGKTGYAFVIDTKGNVIIHPVQKEGTNQYNTKDENGKAFIQEMCREKNGSIIYLLKNPGEKTARLKMVIFNYIPELDWIVASSGYLDEYYQPLYMAKNIAIVVFIALISLVFLITMLFASYFKNYFRKLIHGLHEGSEGDYMVRIPFKNEDEFGKIANYFNDFMEKLMESDKLIQTEMRQKEHIIEERTLLNEQLKGKIIQYEEAKRRGEYFQDISLIDGLTGIPNRRKFDEYLNTVWKFALRDRFPISIVMMDIDHFKLFNDKYGHLNGDECLIQVAQKLSKSVNRKTDIVARYGGEEFVCVLPNTKVSDAMVIAEKLRENVMSLQIPHELSPVASCVTISLGVASVTPIVGSTYSMLISAADEALYKSKNNGRNKVSTIDFKLL